MVVVWRWLYSDGHCGTIVLYSDDSGYDMMMVSMVNVICMVLVI